MFCLFISAFQSNPLYTAGIVHIVHMHVQCIYIFSILILQAVLFKIIQYCINSTFLINHLLLIALQNIAYNLFYMRF